MAKLAIKGHETRGTEVIALLEMLGGINLYDYSADSNSFCFYIGKGINDTNAICYDWIHGCYDDEKWIVFTLEEFEKKFPYKVGDKVYNIIHNENQTITDLAWDSKENEVVYQTNNNEYVFVNYLQPYKKETVEEKKINQMSLANCDLDEVEIFLGDKFEMKIKDGKYYAVKKQPQYPKTYKECCEVLGYSGNYNMILTTDVDNKLFNALYRLKVCRDAYWRIAGEQMGLGKPWEPNWNESKPKYTIVVIENKLEKRFALTQNYILAFPTEEMRDAFFKNFEDLIELCKELL